MDRIGKFLVILIMSGVITACTASSYIPQLGGTIPQGESVEEFSRRQQEAIYSSIGFKITMVGTGISVISLLCVCIRSCIDDYKVEDRTPRGKVLRPILKVKRVHPEAQVEPQAQVQPEAQVQPQVQPIQVVVQDQKPQVRTTPNLTAMVPAQSSSPPAHLVPYSIINRNDLRKTFKYPPPYDIMNR